MERWRRPNRGVGLLLAIFLLTAVSCSKVMRLDHVVLLRSEQDRFSAAATLENERAQDFLSPTKTSLRRTAARWAQQTELSLLLPTADTELMEQLEQEYGGVADALGVLIRSRAEELEMDELLSEAQSLRLFARWRAAFYGHLLNVSRPSRKEGTAAEEPDEPGPAALTLIAGEAGALIDDPAVRARLGPRDRVVLALIPAMARYEAAIIRAIRGQGESDARRVASGAIAEILAADREIVTRFGKFQERKVAHLQDYYYQSRHVFLLTARKISSWADLKNGTEPDQALRKRVQDAIDAYSLTVTAAGFPEEQRDSYLTGLR